MESQIITTISNDELAQFESVVEMTLMTIADSTARNYERHYRQWFHYCREHGLSLFDFNAKHVAHFVNSRPITKDARMKVLASIRKLVQIVAIANNDFMPMYETLKLVKASSKGADNSRKQVRRALAPEEARTVLDTLPPESLSNIRNRALLAVLFYTGMRRSEAAKLKWTDIHYHNGTIDVWSGKGDKDRIVAVVGEECLTRLKLWQSYHNEEREYVFCEIHWNDTLQADSPISGTQVYRIIKMVEAKCGILFKPHDVRRTHITEALNNGAPVHEVQAQAGHSTASTTLDNYAMASDAEKRRDKLKTRY